MTREVGKWLLHEDQKDLLEILVAGTLNILFLALTALLLWPLGSLTLAVRLAKGYCIWWIVLFLIAALVERFQRLFRVGMYDRPYAFVFSNLFGSCALLAAGSLGPKTAKSFTPRTAEAPRAGGE